MSEKFDDCIRRMRRIEGQARGIIRMMEEDRYCVDILQQMLAVEAAMQATRVKVLQKHAASCVDKAIETGDRDAQRRQFDELVEMFAKMAH